MHVLLRNSPCARAEHDRQLSSQRQRASEGCFPRAAVCSQLLLHSIEPILAANGTRALSDCNASRSQRTHHHHNLNHMHELHHLVSWWKNQAFAPVPSTAVLSTFSRWRSACRYANDEIHGTQSNRGIKRNRGKAYLPHMTGDTNNVSQYSIAKSHTSVMATKVAEPAPTANPSPR